MDLSNLGLAELRALESQLKVEIKRRENQDMAQAREKIMAIAHSVGIPLKDLIAASGRTAAAPRGTGRGGAGIARGPVAVRFRHPEDPSLQWTGRGRQPTWLVQWLASGHTLDEVRLPTE
ncbi:MAG: H-NS histone family protein [Burkholderiales bacterium]|nr:H-NS histone family protein [Burkholderiales bacterium]